MSFFDFLDLAIDTMRSSVWHFIAIYVSGFIVSVLLILINDKIQGEVSRAEKVALASAGSWVTVTAIILVSIFIALVFLGVSIVVILQFLLGFKRE